MKKCFECGKEYDDSKRVGAKWEKVFTVMGASADQCDSCLRKWMREK